MFPVGTTLFQSCKGNEPVSELPVGKTTAQFKTVTLYFKCVASLDAGLSDNLGDAAKNSNVSLECAPGCGITPKGGDVRLASEVIEKGGDQLIAQKVFVVTDTVVAYWRGSVFTKVRAGGSNFQVRTAVAEGILPLSRQYVRCVQCFAIHSFPYFNCYFHSNQLNAFCVMPLYHSSSLFVVFANSFENSKKCLTCFGCGVYVSL